MYKFGDLTLEIKLAEKLFATLLNPFFVLVGEHGLSNVVIVSS